MPLRRRTMDAALLPVLAALTWAGNSGTAAAQANNVNPDAALVQEFESHVADYVKLHKEVDSGLTPLKKPTESPENIQHHEHALRRAIVARRSKVGQGNIFTPTVTKEFRRLFAIAYQGDARQINESLRHSEPGTRILQVHVNHEYPDKAPLQSMPPTLLMNLPKLPPELEYRIVGRNLVLRDTGANLIVDVIPEVVPG